MSGHILKIMCHRESKEESKKAKRAKKVKRHAFLSFLLFLPFLLPLLIPLKEPHLTLAASSGATAQAQRRPVLRTASRNHFAGKFILITRDDRPQSLLQPRMLARVTDHDLITPPARVMVSANSLIEWAKSVDYIDTDGVIISLDAITDGSQGTAAPDVVKWIRAKRPAMPIYAFTGASTERSIQSALNLVGESALDFLLISGDAARSIGSDSARTLSDKVAIEPDIDEGAMILLSRMLNRRFGFSPAIFPVYSSAAARNLPMNAGIIAIIRTIGGVEVTQPDQSQSNTASRVIDASLFHPRPADTCPQPRSIGRSDRPERRKRRESRPRRHLRNKREQRSDDR